MENIVKKTCKELGLTYKELAEKIGYSEGGLKNAAASDSVTINIEHAIKMYLKILELEAEVKEMQQLRETLKKLLQI